MQFLIQMERKDREKCGNPSCNAIIYGVKRSLQAPGFAVKLDYFEVIKNVIFDRRRNFCSKCHKSVNNLFNRKKEELEANIRQSSQVVPDTSQNSIVGDGAQGQPMICENSMGNPMQTGDNITADKDPVEIENHDEMIMELEDVNGNGEMQEPQAQDLEPEVLVEIDLQQCKMRYLFTSYQIVATSFKKRLGVSYLTE